MANLPYLANLIARARALSSYSAVAFPIRLMENPTTPLGLSIGEATRT